ncbi:MAG TPA: hypothetical protein VFX04_07230 [Rhodanobacteraceae bacterium]|jgi:hypothetical protein|nr:hypothetical protein [Rhodanobacteraceae bacterium]
MDITHGLQNGSDALENASQQVRHGAHTAMHGVRRAGNEVNSFVHRRPVETALLSAAAACLITGLAFWLSRPD